MFCKWSPTGVYPVTLYTEKYYTNQNTVRYDYQMNWTDIQFITKLCPVLMIFQYYYNNYCNKFCSLYIISVFYLIVKNFFEKENQNVSFNIENELNLGIFHIQFELYQEKNILKSNIIFLWCIIFLKITLRYFIFFLFLI